MLNILDMLKNKKTQKTQFCLPTHFSFAMLNKGRIIFGEEVEQIVSGYLVLKDNRIKTSQYFMPSFYS